MTLKQVKKRRNIYLDLFKFFLALLVISLHTIVFPFSYVNRLGVIMFFMITGYFTYSSDQSKQLKKAKQLVLRSFIYMMIGLGVYFLYDMIKIAKNELTFDVYIAIFRNSKTYKDFFFYSSPPRYVHLWYLIALFFVSIYHYIFVKLKITSAYKWVAICILILVAILYYSVYPRLKQFNPIYVRNSFLMGFPPFAIGFVLNKKKGFFTHPNYFNLIFGTIFFILQITEAVIMNKEIFICSVISAMFFLLFFTNLECKNHKAEEWYYSWIGKGATFWIYLLHWLVMERLDIWKYIDISIAKPVLVLVTTFLVYEVGFLLVKFLRFVFSKSDNQKEEPQLVVSDGENIEQ